MDFYLTLDNQCQYFSAFSDQLDIHDQLTLFVKPLAAQERGVLFCFYRCDVCIIIIMHTSHRYKTKQNTPYVTSI